MWIGQTCLKKRGVEESSKLHSSSSGPEKQHLLFFSETHTGVFWKVFPSEYVNKCLLIEIHNHTPVITQSQLGCLSSGGCPWRPGRWWPSGELCRSDGPARKNQIFNLKIEDLSVFVPSVYAYSQQLGRYTCTKYGSHYSVVRLPAHSPLQFWDSTASLYSHLRPLTGTCKNSV